MTYPITQLPHLLAALLLIISSATAFAGPQISLEIIAEKDVVEINEQGEEVTRRVVANDTIPGDTLFYILRYSNGGTEAARNVQIDNPMPANTSYVADSAWGDGTDILFSIDEGKSYKKPVNLTYEITDRGGQKRKLQASPEQYNAIRWTVTEILPSTGGSVGFSVVVQ
ncbi:MAG: hypothetical protein ACK4SX_05310 [Alcanivoracaceae bacterium]